MTKLITAKEAEIELSEKLMGCSIDKVSYNITGWELRFIHPVSNEYYLDASEISVPSIETWWDGTRNLPIPIQNTNEADDTIVAINIFTVLNKWPVSLVTIGSDGNLNLEFENSVRLIISGIVDYVDWTWHFRTSNEPNEITCDSGVLYASHLF